MIRRTTLQLGHRAITIDIHEAFTDEARSKTTGGYCDKQSCGTMSGVVLKQSRTARRRRTFGELNTASHGADVATEFLLAPLVFSDA
jgi:hypothetical protein